MRKHFFSFPFLLLSIAASAQTKLQVVNDSVRVNNAELIIRNSTKDVQGYLYNTGNGLTHFKTIDGNYITGLTGDVTATGPGAAAATVGFNKITFAKFQQINTAKLLGRNTAGTGNVEEISIGGNLTLTGGVLNAVGGSGLTSLNALSGSTQTFATGTTGTNFNISSASNVHVFNIPDASATARGLITTGTQSIAGIKTFSSPIRTQRYGGGAVDSGIVIEMLSKMGIAHGTSYAYSVDYQKMDFYMGYVQPAYRFFDTLWSGPSYSDSRAIFLLRGRQFGAFGQGEARFRVPLYPDGGLQMGSGALYLKDYGAAADRGMQMYVGTFGGFGVSAQGLSTASTVDYVDRDDPYPTNAHWRWYIGTYNAALATNSTLMSLGTSGLILNTAPLVVGSGSPNTSASITVNGTTKGVLLSRLTTTQRDAVPTPANGLFTVNTSRTNLGFYASNSWTELYGSKYILATDAAYTFDASADFVNLPTISANRIVSLPAAATYVSKTLTIKVANSTGFSWSTNVSIYDNTDTGLTALANDTVYTIKSDGSNWYIISKYP